ncbi:MAG: Rne/Rng family ribonuclease [Armatimonadetes bacterium]|nr:Rne/Rng family ribonuclease [Armatimonadota bacterium]
MGSRRSRRPESATATASSKEIIINVSPREDRVAIVENGQLIELNIEREERVVGSIYKGKVVNVLPGMDAAFVEIGLEKNAFLYVGDILPGAEDEVEATEDEAAAADAPAPAPPRRNGRRPGIREVAKVGQQVLVQVVKAPRGTKGARVSTRISLPGRYLVLMPDTDHVGVSRKIEEEPERERLKELARQVKPQGMGLIVRTEAEGRNLEDMKADAEFLTRLWQTIQEKAKQANAPAVIHTELSLLFRTVRDSFVSDVNKLIVDSEPAYQKILELVDLISPRMRGRVELFRKRDPIFHRFGIDNEIERLLRPRIWLKSGGYLVIDESEALTTIDVNTGKFIGSTNLADTILRTNLEAATEVARQLRLRDIGGIIIIDFIDMDAKKDKDAVMNALKNELKRDRARTKVAHISPLGLVEMTRKRTGETILAQMTTHCPYCAGRGAILSPETVSVRCERELARVAADVDDEAFMVTLHPDVAYMFIGAGGDNVQRLEQTLHRAVFARSDEDLHREQYRIVPGDLQEMDRQLQRVKPRQVMELPVVKHPLTQAPRAAAWVDGYLVDLENGAPFIGERAKVRVRRMNRSFALGEVVLPAKVVDKSEPI